MERNEISSLLKIGEKAPYFSLPATDGKIYSLSDFSENQVLAVIFTCNHCPYAKAAEPFIYDAAKEFKQNGLQVICICSNDEESFPEDSFGRMVEKSKEIDFMYPYLQDKTQNVAKAYDAACTPEAYIFDEHAKLRYQGKIINSHQTNNPENLLSKAIASLLKNEKPDPEVDLAIGCSIKWKL